MLPFWDRALNLLDDFTINDHEYNSEGVPISYAKNKDDFEYEVFLIVKKQIDRLNRKINHSKFGGLNIMDVYAKPKRNIGCRL